LDESVRVWDAASGRQLRTLPSGELSPDGKTLAFRAKDDRIELWDVVQGKIRCQLELKPSTITGALAYTPDGRTLATTGFDETIRLWDVTTGKEQKRIKGPFKYYTVPSFTSDGQKFLFLNPKEETFDLWDVATGRNTMVLRTEKIEFPALMAPDWKILATLGRSSNSAYRADLILLWEIGNMTPIRRLPWRTLEKDFRSGKLTSYSPSEPLAFSADGRRITGLAGPNNEILRLWDLATGREARRFVGHKSEIERVLFSPDGRLLATVDQMQVIRVWDVATSQEIAVCLGHEGEIESIDFSPDGRLLVSGSTDTTALVWDLTSCLEAGRLPSGRLDEKESVALWNQLAHADARKARRAMWKLVADPDRSVAFLKKHVLAIPSLDGEKVARLVADLDSDDFDKREAADEELAKLGEPAAVALSKLLASKPSEQARRRASEILERIAVALPTPDQARVLRAVEALEHMKTNGATDVLKDFAGQTNHSGMAREAKAALARMTAETEKKP
jgi:WD40 repeat protein